MAQKKLTLDEYLSWLADQTNSFRALWRRNQKTGKKKDWPEKMYPGDWDEQFEAHITTVRQGDESYED